MFKYSALSAIACVMLLGGPAVADSHDKTGEDTAKEAASIPFADFRGQIRNWRDEGRDAILIESGTGQWYRAEFMSPCHGLPFADTIGFPLDATGKVDKFSSVLVRQAGGMLEECWFKSFVEIPDPDKTKKDE